MMEYKYVLSIHGYPIAVVSDLMFAKMFEEILYNREEPFFTTYIPDEIRQSEGPDFHPCVDITKVPHVDA